MRKYRPIATYDTAEDIVSLFPCDAIKPDMADIIYNHYKEGFGEPREIDSRNDEESWWTEDEIREDEAKGFFFFTKDGNHGVSFTRGFMASGVPMGYYIDIYEAFDDGQPEEGITDEELEAMSRRRKEEDSKVKSQIIKEFKAAFKNEGEGLDFYEYADNTIYGMLDTTGPIGKMVLGDVGRIYVSLIQEYEDSWECFEDDFFSVEDWPMFLLSVREGIKKGWTIEPEDE